VVPAADDKHERRCTRPLPLTVLQVQRLSSTAFGETWPESIAGGYWGANMWIAVLKAGYSVLARWRFR